MTTKQPEPALTEEPTIGRLVVDTATDFSQLIRSEIELAKTELKVSAKAGGIGIGLFAGAAFLVLLAIVMVSIALALFLDWWIVGTATAFLIVFALYVLIAALLAFIGVRKVKQVKAPEQAIEAVKDTKQVFSH
jgi:Putative Actinobacterial Holin-X, holin superfamily III